ncbi:hypothetical protein D3C84_1003650 [compost metagenome]
MVECFVDEANELDFSNWTETLRTHTDCHTSDCGFSERRIEYALLAEFLLQSFCYTEYTADLTDVLTKNKNVRVLLQFHAHRIAERL